MLAFSGIATVGVLTQERNTAMEGFKGLGKGRFQSVIFTQLSSCEKRSILFVEFVGKNPHLGCNQRTDQEYELGLSQNWGYAEIGILQ